MSTQHDFFVQRDFEVAALRYGRHVHRPTRVSGQFGPGAHRRDKVSAWYTGLVIWNFTTELFDRVKIVDRHGPSMARYRTMSYPVIEDEDEETAWVMK